MKSFVLSVGGSLIVPKNIDIEFLKAFKKLIEKHVRQGSRFFIIAGGGRTAREYQSAVKNVIKASNTDLDWIGIHATRLNAHLLRIIFKEIAYKHIIENPSKMFKTNKKVIIAAGYKPGCSTDYDAVLIAKTWNIKTVINLTNIYHVYDKNPKIYKDAKPLKNISWETLRSIVGNEWRPGLNTPFDPIASKLASKLGLKVIITNGKDLKNLDKVFKGEAFKGTIIS